jgi:hypothetical protein
VALTDLDATVTAPVVHATDDGSALMPSARKRSSGRILALAAGWIAMLAPFAFELAAIVRSGHVALVRRFPDDGFYYLEIATRLARGQGFTFDGIHATNGFHPLWEFMLVPVAAVFAGDALIRAAAVLGLVICLVALLLVVRVVWRAAGPGPALFGGVVATQFALHGWVNGMEGPAVLLAVALLLTALAAADRESPGRWFLVGLCSAVLVLARLDFALVIAIVPVALWLRSRSWRVVGWWCAGGAVLAVPFGGWWVLRWQHLLTTSATVKNAAIDRAICHEFGGRLTSGYTRFLVDTGHRYLTVLEPWAYLDPGPSATRGAVVLRGLLVVSLVAVAGLGVVVSVQRLRRTRDIDAARLGACGWSLVVVLTLLGAKAALDVLVAPLWATAWYSAPQRLAAGMFIGATAWLGIEWLRPRFKVLGLVAVAVAVFAAIPVNANAWRAVDRAPHSDANWQDQIDLAAAWIEGHGPVGIYGARDAGLLAHRLDGVRTVVNLDGLVNDYAFARLVTRGASLRHRIVVSHVDYLVNRLSGHELRRLGCGTVLWRSPGAVPYADQLSGLSMAHVDVVDVRACAAD